VTKRRRRLLLTVLSLAILFALAGLAIARPGGGESYSGGGGHGGGSSGGGGGGGGGIGDIFELIELIFWIIEMCIEHPLGALVVVGGIGAWIAWSAYKQHRNKDWDSGPPVSLARSTDLHAIKKLDPDFSQIVFEDFVFRLFSTAQRARHSAQTLGTVAPYVSAPARAALAERAPVGAPVKQVIVGALRVAGAVIPQKATDTDGDPERVAITVQLEANVALAGKTIFSVETWTFARDATLKTKPPSAAKAFPCPNCGAPWQSSATGTQLCASCGQVVDNGRFDWVVESIFVDSESERAPTLTTDVPERGTDLPTYKQPGVELAATDARFDTPALTKRLELIFDELGPAWSKNDLTAVRGLVSDGLYDYLDYWVTAYRDQGLRNMMRDTRITRTELAKITRDRWYDAVTIRIWATGVDYVIQDKTGQVVRGSKRRPRPYSEYWTLIRSSARQGPPVTKRACGNCGAPLEVTMAGACTHCGAHLTAGEFDWVLSKIEQDDSYRG
jgi:hypothetical protein